MWKLLRNGRRMSFIITAAAINNHVAVNHNRRRLNSANTRTAAPPSERIFADCCCNITEWQIELKVQRVSLSNPAARNHCAVRYEYWHPACSRFDQRRWRMCPQPTTLTLHRLSTDWRHSRAQRRGKFHSARTMQRKKCNNASDQATHLSAVMRNLDAIRLVKLNESALTPR